MIIEELNKRVRWSYRVEQEGRKQANGEFACVNPNDTMRGREFYIVEASTPAFNISFKSFNRKDAQAMFDQVRQMATMWDRQSQEAAHV